MKFPCDLETWLGGGAGVGVQRSNLLRNNLYVRFCLYTVPLLPNILTLKLELSNRLVLYYMFNLLYIIL